MPHYVRSTLGERNSYSWETCGTWSPWGSQVDLFIKIFRRSSAFSIRVLVYNA